MLHCLGCPRHDPTVESGKVAAWFLELQSVHSPEVEKEVGLKWDCLFALNSGNLLFSFLARGGIAYFILE